MATFFTSDTHLGHANIIKYSKRPFMTKQEQEMLAQNIPFKPCKETVDLHDTVLINRINNRVGRDDELYILGDFCWGGYDKAYAYRKQINCRNVYLIWGNHDHPSVEECFEMQDHLKMIKVEGQELVLCHYPMRSWEKSHHGSWQLFGHVHGNLADVPHLLTLDVGVDTHNFYPWTWQEICSYMSNRIPAYAAYRNSWKDKERGGMAPGTHE